LEHSDHRRIVTTGDGSSSVYSPVFNEQYHSHHGAIQESLHVFIRNGWQEAITNKTNISILEMGFGTGLNAFLVYLEMQKQNDLFVNYDSLEAFPIGMEIITALDYPVQTNSLQLKDVFLAMHECQWEKPVEIHERFVLTKLQKKIEQVELEKNKYDLIFFDAFSPRSQPELWTKEVFEKMYAAAKPNAVLVTYCAKGQVRRNMQAAGFSVERLDGPPGKREMLRARKLATD
jgi:tRNA U34 5-methylaminomethyl-2-thiouridine-forming methyltransferase MnmC